MSLSLEWKEKIPSELKCIFRCAVLNRHKNTLSLTGTCEFFWLAKALP